MLRNYFQKTNASIFENTFGSSPKKIKNELYIFIDRFI